MAAPDPRVGIAFVPESSAQALDLIGRAERAGIDTVWTVMPATGLDTPTLFAAALATTERVRLGTAIVPAFTRHPIMMATQALALEGLGPGRFRLGLGTSHARTMVDVYHLDFARPLSQLREYVSVLRPLLHEGESHFRGDFYAVDATMGRTAPTPVLVSALRAPAWELAGELTDGGISWLCPVDFLLRVAVPALATGADRAGRARPPLVAHVPVVARRDREEVRAIARQQLAYYAAAPFYARMFADAGFPLQVDGQVSDALVDDLVVSGSAAEIATGVRARLDRGLDEVLVSVLAGPDRRADEAALVEAAARV